MKVRDSQEAFTNALTVGMLTLDRTNTTDRYVGDFMYMYTDETFDWFKNRNTREYVKVRPDTRIQKVDVGGE